MQPATPRGTIRALELILALGFLCSPVAAASARSTILPTDSVALTGVVVDSSNGQPVAGAEVRVSRGTILVARASTDAAGRYVVSLPNGSYTVEVRGIGYRIVSRDVTVAGAGAAADFRLLQALAVLSTIEVVGSIQPTASMDVNSEIPARTTILTSAQIQALQPRVLSDVLRQQAGFSSFDDLGSPNKITVGSRGFFASPVVGVSQGVSVFLDGVRQNEPDAAQVNWDLLPMEHIKRVEILSGNGTLLGRNSLGGAINLITKRGTTQPSGELELERGTYGMTAGHASAGGQFKSGIDYYVGGGFDGEDGFRQHEQSRKYNLFTNVGKLTPTSGVRFQVYGGRSGSDTPASIPIALFADRPDSAFSPDSERINSIQAAFTGYREGTNTRESLSLYYRRHRADRLNANQIEDPDVAGHAQNDVYGGTADYRRRFLVDTKEVDLRFGLDGSGSATRFQLFLDSTKFHVPHPLVETSSISSPVWDAGGYVAANLDVDPFNFSVGGRYDVVGIPFHDLIRSTDASQTYSQFNPRAGVNVDLGGGLALLASWGTAFRAPAVIEVACADPLQPCALPYFLGADPPIKPVKTNTGEVGVTWTRPHFSFSGSGYFTNVRDEIFLVPYPGAPPGGSTISGYFVNVDRTRRAGIEAQANVSTARGVSVYLNYSYTDATFQATQTLSSPLTDPALGIVDHVTPGKRLTLVPDHQVKGGFVLPVRDFVFSAEGRYIGKQFLRGDEANLMRPLNGHFVADARAAYARGQWYVSLNSSNIFNNHYASFGTYNTDQSAARGPTFQEFLTPAWPRQLRLTVGMRYGRGEE